MTDPRELMYWLQGFFEVSGAKTLDEDQTLKIRMKLESCFEKVTSPIKSKDEGADFEREYPCNFEDDKGPPYSSLEPILNDPVLWGKIFEKDTKYC